MLAAPLSATFMITTPLISSASWKRVRSSSVMVATVTPSASMSAEVGVLASLSVSAASSSSSGSSPSVTSNVLRSPWRQTTTLAASPIGVSATIRGRPRIRSIFLPSNSRMTSPASILACSAGPPGVTLATSAPAAPCRPRLSAISSVTVWIRTPEPAALDLAFGLERLDHRHGEVGRDREADADVAAARREDRGVDPDHLAAQIEGRAAGVAAIDRRVDLQEVVVRPGVDVARRAPR